jgi:hypothetical protein
MLRRSKRKSLPSEPSQEINRAKDSGCDAISGSSEIEERIMRYMKGFNHHDGYLSPRFGRGARNAAI